MLKTKLHNRIIRALNHSDLNPTEKQHYLHWIHAFMRFHQFVNPQLLNDSDIQQFITHTQYTKPGSQFQQLAAKNAIHFLYESILQKPLDQPVMTACRPFESHFAA